MKFRLIEAESSKEIIIVAKNRELKDWAVEFDLKEFDNKDEDKVRKLAQYVCDVLNEGD